MTFSEFLDVVALAAQTVGLILGILGALVIVYGTLRVLVLFLQESFQQGAGRRHSTTEARLELGGFLTFGLEFFIAKDILETLIVPSWDRIGILAVLVALRTILSFFLMHEGRMLKRDRFGHSS